MVIKQSVASKWFEDSLCNKNFPRHGKDWRFSQKFFTTKSLVFYDLIVTYLRLSRKYLMTDLKDTKNQADTYYRWLEPRPGRPDSSSLRHTPSWMGYTVSPSNKRSATHTGSLC